MDFVKQSIVACGLVIFVCVLVHAQKEDAEQPTTRRSIIVFKISPDSVQKYQQSVDEFWRRFRQPLYPSASASGSSTESRENQIDTSNPNVKPTFITKFPSYEHPAQKPDLEYHTTIIIYFISISFAIVLIGIASCLCLNKCKDNSSAGPIGSRNNNVNRSSISIISSAGSAATSTTSVNLCPSNANGTGSDKVLMDLPPSYDSLFPNPNANKT